MKKTILIIIIATITFNNLKSQDKAKQYQTDVNSIENIVNALLETISGDKGVERDWDRFRNLFLPTAQLTGVFHRGDSTFVRVNTLEEFIKKNRAWYKDNGFYEYSYKNTINEFGNIAQVFQSYGSKFQGQDEMQRGINSYMLVYEKNRWWIVNTIWDSETNTHKIPEIYLH